ncbi:hypothetical protein PhCBS80983_g00521 [Powellomyces hirtus]|uniref:Polynucleotide 5'-hydroxyl-kinase GRC3 n=1 Tax=Powellomyces hirtus TaxID=109895 RepID=A0A507EF59_9FUNG|nr:hypothetical protein PhCBS80983_g00521 [Powellomyces hirtus]
MHSNDKEASFSAYSHNSFSALRSLKKVKRPTVGSPITNVGHARLSEVITTSAVPASLDDILAKPALLHAPRSGDAAVHRERRGRMTAAEGRERGNVVERVEVGPIAVSTFRPSAENVVSNGKDLCLLGLRAGETIGFQGVFTFTPILGHFTLFGLEFSGDIEWASICNNSMAMLRSRPPPTYFHPCFAPSSHSVPVFTAKAEANPLLDGNVAAVERRWETSVMASSEILAEIKELLERLAVREERDVTVIAIRAMSDRSIVDVTRSLPNMRQWFGDESSFDSPDGINIPGVVPLLNPNPDVRPLIIPREWDLATHSLLAGPASSRTVLCTVGSKNMGKSTFGRYLVNKLMNRYTKVAYLECDIGQCEHTPTGMASLHLLTSPILGPPYTHLSQPYRSAYIGDTSPRSDPDYYLACLRHLFHVYETEVAHGDDDGESVPVVVNTHGWIKGMGLDLLVHFLRGVKPTIVFQMSVPRQNPGSGSKNILADLKGMLSTVASPDDPPIAEPHSQSSTTPSFIPHITDIPALSDHASSSPLSSSAPPALGAADHRVLSLVSYFHQHPPPPPINNNNNNNNNDGHPYRQWTFDTPLTARIPFRVPFSHIRIKFLHGEIPFSQTLHALNGCVVGLVVDRTLYQQPPPPHPTHGVPPPPVIDPTHHHHHSTALRIIPSQIPFLPSMAHCVGLGLVRAVDTTQEGGAFHILTGPIPHDQLRDVNTIVRGCGAETPIPLLAGGFENSRVQIPYTTTSASEGVGSLAWRTRHNLNRRRPAA